MVLEKAKEFGRRAVVEQIGRLLADASPKTLAKLWWLFEKTSSRPSDRAEPGRP